MKQDRILLCGATTEQLVDEIDGILDDGDTIQYILKLQQRMDSYGLASYTDYLIIVNVYDTWLSQALNIINKLILSLRNKTK